MYNYSILDDSAGVVSTGQTESDSDGKFTVIGQELSAECISKYQQCPSLYLSQPATLLLTNFADNRAE